MVLIINIFFISRLFSGPHHTFLKEINLTKYNIENGDSCFKCNVDEVNKLLSIKRLLLEQPRYERWYILFNQNTFHYYAL